jgi:hemerythrin-like domain-containing protein
VVNAAHGYVELLRTHIYKEDYILFPLADRAIPTEEQKNVLEAFGRGSSTRRREIPGHGREAEEPDIAGHS